MPTPPRTITVSLPSEVTLAVDAISHESGRSRTAVLLGIVEPFVRHMEAIALVHRNAPHYTGDRGADALAGLEGVLCQGLTEWALRRPMTAEGLRLSPHWLWAQKTLREAFDQIELAMDDAQGGRRGDGTRHLYVFVPSEAVGLPPGFVAPHYRPHGEEAGIIAPTPAQPGAPVPEGEPTEAEIADAKIIDDPAD